MTQTFFLLFAASAFAQSPSKVMLNSDFVNSTNTWTAQQNFQQSIGIASSATANAALTVNGCIAYAGGVLGTCSSDARLKENIRYLPGSLETLLRLKPASFRFKQGLAGESYGLIAQDVQKEAPELVARDPAGYLAVNYSPLTMMLLKAVQEQQAQLRKLNARIQELEKERH